MYIDKDDLITHFFRVFGIEPIPIKSYGYWLIKGSIAENDKGEKVVYPEITDRKLLKMICILSQSYPLNYEGWSFYTVQELKETILEDCIKTTKKLSLSSDFANKIQQLFKEGE